MFTDDLYDRNQPQSIIPFEETGITPFFFSFFFFQHPGGEIVRDSIPLYVPSIVLAKIPTTKFLNLSSVIFTIIPYFPRTTSFFRGAPSNFSSSVPRDHGKRVIAQLIKRSSDIYIYILETIRCTKLPREIAFLPTILVKYCPEREPVHVSSDIQTISTMFLQKKEEIRIRLIVD